MSIVTIATYRQSNAAYFLKEKLEEENMDCFFAKIRQSEGPWDEIRVQVRDYDVERAFNEYLAPTIQARYKPV